MSDLSYRGFALDAETALALLQWQAEMGADEPCLDEAIDRYDEAEALALARANDRAIKAAAPAYAQGEASEQAGGQMMPGGLPMAVSTQPRPAAAAAGPDYAAIAAQAAGQAQSLDALAQAMAAFDGIDLKKGARNFCFADGNPAARVMIIGEAPGAEEDQRGLPFVGAAGQLLDKMFAAIGLSRTAEQADKALYITNVLPWHPTGNRPPHPDEIAMILPFLARHVELANPDVLVLFGNIPCQAALGRSGILKMRGEWQTAFGRPALPMTHPAYLLRTPLAKREAWADLLALQARLGNKPD
ncbi:uracil-DNA glycosylase [Paracoccus sp. (in: a-proteobacteria)]|uniref:uracil-DNA glycosylase n=1 Tax=Paracoccus sp. TaxID=267 RepID=UPI0028984BF9|nr:uracil-DNA glycosylase [Paracoccus sp. (in: a-proteobacteria)]